MRCAMDSIVVTAIVVWISAWVIFHALAGW